MFSAHFTKAERWPVTNLIVLAGLLTVLFQLVAAALVADEQIDKVELRDQRNRAHDAAMADCLDRMQLVVRPLRHGCIQLVQAVNDSSANRDAVDSLQGARQTGAPESPVPTRLLASNDERFVTPLPPTFNLPAR